MKETYYFPHDFHARNDPKCAALLNDFGASGYGLYWCMIEILHEQKDGKLEKFPKLLSGLSYDFNVPIEALTKQIEALINDYNLLREDEKYIWSDRVIENLENRKLKYYTKSEAGKLGGLKSGESRKSKQNEAVLEADEAVLEADEQKERKGKERKEKKSKEEDIKDTYSDCVLLSKDEFSKLTESFGIEGTNQRIKNLNDYVMSKGAKYKSHYHTILNWERKRGHGKAGTVFVNKAQVLMDQNIQAGKEAMAFLEEKYNDDGSVRDEESK